MPTASNARASSRIPELDGLRGFAILIVLLLHYFYRVMAATTPAFHKFQAIFRLGWTGVDLFFVLSGFLIGGILLDARSSPSYFKTFYVRRFFRIFPIYYLWIIAYIVLAVLGGEALQQHSNSHQLPQLGFGVYEHFFFLQNIFVPDLQTISLYWLGPLWSLAVEEQFYLVAPLVIRYLSHRALYVFLGATIVLALLLRVYFRLIHPTPAISPYAFTLCRADALSMGVLAALLWREERFRNWLARSSGFLYATLTILAAGMFLLWYDFSIPTDPVTITIGLSWVALFYFVLLLAVLTYKESVFARCARIGWLRELGKVSYCVYVIHFGLSYVLFGLFFRRIPYLSDLKSLVLTLVSFPLLYFAARVSWHYLEGPLVEMGHRFSYAKAASVERANHE